MHTVPRPTNSTQQNDNGLNLRTTDAIDYIKWMAAEASKYNMTTGLKNSLDIVDDLASTVAFAVNEQCAQLNECDRYTSFLAAGKPVFHIEYPTPLNTGAATGVSCTAAGTTGMSTILKNMALDGPAVYCDGSQVDTPTKGGSSPPRPSRTPRPTTTRPPVTPRPTTSRTTTSRPTTTTSRPIFTPPPTTTRPPPTTTRQTSSARPTTTQSPGGGCRSKHWDQCGGNDWKGCTVCEVSHSFPPPSFSSFPVSFGCSCTVLILDRSRRIHARVCRRRGITSVCERRRISAGRDGMRIIHGSVVFRVRGLACIYTRLMLHVC